MVGSAVLVTIVRRACVARAGVQLGAAQDLGRRGTLPLRGLVAGLPPPCTLFAVAASEHMNTLLNHMR